eukprot:CAMPEP_0113884722 /NCGR_PEP_ID=MMETSP0780_2-20120614/10453_1 /TAXON_ID=652834 /ORGANISM="Palpitomonas bilix" /LENGTH=408 /DNA_ID=CAMNT_0000872449 /DNA_START=48 /DNA_END=1274 /DNA_ORIENTATION=- /assembly_acc=CAM_ASM_000599
MPSTRSISVGHKLQWLPVIAAVTATTLIFVDYITAASLHHVPWWFPDITHCARYAPERYFFRAVMIPCCIGIAVVWMLVHDFSANSRNLWLSGKGLPRQSVRGCGQRRTWAMWLGVVGAVCLIIASSVLESDGSTLWVIHTVGASSFFALNLIGQLLTTIDFSKMHKDGCPGVGKASVRAKIAITSVQLSLAALDGLLAAVGAPSAWGNLMEWLLTFSIIAYNITYKLDFEQKLYADITLDVPSPSSRTQSSTPRAQPNGGARQVELSPLSPQQGSHSMAASVGYANTNGLYPQHVVLQPAGHLFYPAHSGYATSYLSSPQFQSHPPLHVHQQGQGGGSSQTAAASAMPPPTSAPAHSTATSPPVNPPPSLYPSAGALSSHSGSGQSTGYAAVPHTPSSGNRGYAQLA